MYLDEFNTRRVAYVIAGLLIWIFHIFIRLALWPLSNLGESYYFWVGMGVMVVLTALCAYYLLLLTPGNKVLAALVLSLVWLLVYAVAEYSRNLIMTHAFTYPLASLVRLALALIYLPITTLACGIVLQTTRRKKSGY